MIAAIDRTLMKTIKLQLYVCFVIFSGKLNVYFIFSLSTGTFDLVLCVQTSELPVNNRTFFFISHKEIETLEFFLGNFSHPFFNRHRLIVVFEDFLADYVTRCVDDFEEVIDELVLTLNSFDEGRVSGLSCSLYKIFNQFVELNPFFLLHDWTASVLLLNPLNLREVLFTVW